jgi:hypothetical protein
MTRFAAVRRMLAIMLLALWWGGFSFYAGRVVFIGHEVLRSRIRQGFITERVTNELNWLASVTLALAAWEPGGRTQVNPIASLAMDGVGYHRCHDDCVVCSSREARQPA